MKLNKKQKRTATIASMAALLAVVLGMGGQTFAKYIYTHEVEAQTATVAKWGLTASVSVGKLFGEAYDGTTHQVSNSGTGLSVLGAAPVIAPGTNGFMTIDLAGQAEVDAKVTVEVDESEISLPSLKWDNNKTYYPIVWTIGSTTARTPAELVAALESISTVYEVDGGAGYDVASHKISWAWDFDDNGAGTNDKLDTILATYTSGTHTIDKVLYEVNVELSVSFDVKITQLD